MKQLLRSLFRHFGLDLVRTPSPSDYPSDFDLEAIDVIRTVRPYTMTTPERLFALIEAVRYVVLKNIPGSIVECGVWKGGSMMAVALALQKLGAHSRELQLFDTFTGMTPPTNLDVSYRGESAPSEYDNRRMGDDVNSWCYASLEEVQENLSRTGYPSRQIKFSQGDVAETIPSQAPNEISVLRLDTDWYESTRHELAHLFPRLSKGGVLIIDDYGHWQGARRAVDEYFSSSNYSVFLHRIDYTGRIAIKMQ